MSLKMNRWLGLLLVIACVAAVYAADAKSSREELQKVHQAGNYKDAFEGYQRLALDPTEDPKQVGNDLRTAIQCLQQLGRVDEIDEFRESVIAVHAKNWRLLNAAADSFFATENYGFIIAGKFHRGQHRGGGKLVNSAERDRVRALQLMLQALPLAKADDDKGEVSTFYSSFANLLLGNRGYSEAWRLQYLTDFESLPDYDEGWYYGRNAAGAPVDAEGNPVYYVVPKSLEDSKNDGERWRWCLSQAVEMAPARRNSIRYTFADFLQNQFGVQTLQRYGWFFGLRADDDTKKDESGTYELHTLSDEETIAQLATGIKRFKLPDEFNFIKIYQEIADNSKQGYADVSLEQLAQAFENRRQYPRAAEYWRRVIKEFGPGVNNYRQDRFNQIVDNWGRFEPIMTQPAGKGATVEYRFRNGKQVEFEAHALKVEQLLADVKAYFKAKPNQVDGSKANIGDLGYTIVQADQKKYVGNKVASWNLDLEPREQHFDKRITVTTPLQKAGAYLLSAKMAGGNTSHIIVWIADTSIVKKPLDKRGYYFVADAVTGAPIAKANVEFFGWRQQHVKNNTFRIDTLNFSEFTDADGQVMPDAKRQPSDYQWVAIARTPQGRLAYLGFTGVWHGNYYDAQYNETKVYTITDRPVYRPTQTVKFKFWVRHAKYDQADTSSFANQDFSVEVHNPKGEKVLTKGFKSDEYGGFEGEMELPADAVLGVYQLLIPSLGGGNFRVEEYKKPEFEVKVEAPTAPIMLGEKITASVEAKYYFGAPVTEAKVKYKVYRTGYDQRWYPIGRWDWFYGPGYWWFAYDYVWYPGWYEWGCRRPYPIWAWWGRAQQPPELVAEQEVEIGKDGKIKIEIDTATAKAIHPDEDHQYQITAEVVDQSRRTIVGTGNVMVARKPFKVFSWVDRGYFRVGDVVKAHFQAQTLDQKPVAGEGVVKLLRIKYDENDKPQETPVLEQKLNTDEQGRADVQLKASEAGQYRVSYTLTDAAGHSIEGAYIFTVIGQGTDGSKFRFNEVELVTDKREYKPGEKVKLQINLDHADGTALLFVRPANGIYLAPKILRLKGKTTVQEIEIATKDMPNVFVEALTVVNGKVYTELREIIVPPEKRVLDVAVEPSSKEYKPGEKAQVKVKLTDSAGKPFVGSTVLSIYDKSVEYISGGSNVGEIREFFWKWRRTHHITTESSLNRSSWNLPFPGPPGMNDIGAFGATSVDELAEGLRSDRSRSLSEENGRMRGGMGGRGELFSRRSNSALGAAPASAAMDGALGDTMEALTLAKQAPGQTGAELQPPPSAVQPSVRTKFADTALWVGSLTTNQQGEAEVSLDMPENLTAWKVKVWGMGHGTKVGQGEAEVVTRKNLIIRMQAPRFFVEKDEVVLSANVHNYLDKRKSVEVVLDLDGKELLPTGDLGRKIEIEAGQEARVDWLVKVNAEGEAVVRMKALTDEESDAMEMRFPVYVHGMLKTESWAGAIRPDKDSAQVSITVPKERRVNQSRLEIRYSPTLAGAMVDALPYLVDYPYDTTDATLTRFLPTVITQKILLDMQLDLKAIQQKRTNLNAQEIGDDVERAKGWKRYDRNPVFDVEEVQSMVKSGVQTLSEMQLSDGGWGWFSGWGEHSDPHATAFVVHGLLLAKANDVAIVPGVVERGVEWLKQYQDRQTQFLKNAAKKIDPWKQFADDLDSFVYMVLVEADVKNQDMMDFLHRDRTKLSVYTKAMFGLALHKQGEKEKLDAVMRNLSQYVIRDAENQTAYLKLPQNNYWWYWYGSEYEAHAYYLKLLSRVEPKSEIAAELVKYLINNRKHATYWNSTRDTATVIEAMAEYLKATGEHKPELTVQVLIDGKQRKEVKIDAENLFSFDNKLVLEGDAIESGEHKIELRKLGRGPLYFNAYLTNFTLEDDIKRAGLEVKVNRKYYKLKPVEKQIKVAGSRGQAVDQKVEKYERVPLENLSTLKSGDLVEIELEIDSKNDYEHLMFEDMKAAGFEPVDQRSGYNGNSLGAYMELRDNRVTFFARTLARGKHSVSYRMRAETPGKFAALPTRASGVYAPELKANSDEVKLRIED